jgi:carboxypeptidase Q
MLRRYAAVALLSIFVLSPNAAFTQQPAATASAQTAPSTDPIDRIKDEGMNRSQVMKTLSYLTDVIGPRLTNSPNMKRANEWTRDEMTKWGMQNAHLEPWGPFGRGWSLKRFSAQVVEPQAIPLIAYPKAWSPGTDGVVTSDVIYLNAKDEVELEKFKGKLKGAIVLVSPMREVKARFEAMGTRRDEKDLLNLADAPEPRPGQRRIFQMTPEQRAAFQLGVKKYQLLLDEGAAVAIDPSRIGDGGTIFVQSATVPQPLPTEPIGPNSRGIGPYDRSAPRMTPQLVLAVEHYNRIIRMIEAGEKVRMSVDLAVQYQDADLMGYNTVAEIPGTDLKDEVVMLGGHMDSWHAGTGATDNGAGVAVGMEAMRIIQSLGLKPRRTIRIALWSGEEQGLLGSRAYVAEHFGKMETPATPAGAGNGNGNGGPGSPTPVLVTKPDYEKLSAYFNLDNGTGKVRGVYLQGNEAVRPLFRQWLMAFRDRPEDKTVWGASTLSISNTGGTDHLAFDAIGLPGFQFIQDEIEYDTRTHHSNQDVFDRIQGDDMKQAATIMAAFVYNAAMLDQKLPRKPMPGR